MENNFYGQIGHPVPEMTDDIVEMVSDRYIELYESITGEPFHKADSTQVIARIEKNIKEFLQG